MQHKAPQSDITLPPSDELFDKPTLVARHPNFLSESRLQWAVRHRATNGLAGVVFETRGGELLIHEPGFLRWFLGLEGRGKPRALRTRRRNSRA